MHNIRKIQDDLYNLGVNDRRITLFENAHPVPRGMNYNSYLLLDEKTVLVDAIDRAVQDQFLENLTAALAGRELDYLIVQHMEPDHCALIPEISRRYPKMKIVGNKKTFQFISQFYEIDLTDRTLEVKEGDVLETGRHKLTFVFAPMVHWPEVMLTYDQTDKILFSADAFGTFGPVDGLMYADQYDFEREYLPEARRYYTSIVGKYGRQVSGLIEKVAGLEFSMFCTLHGPIWRKDLHLILEKYQKWASYTPEERGVVIAYASVYNNTQVAVEILANKLAEGGEQKIVVHNVSSSDPSYVLSDCFRFDRIVLASSTFNNEVFPYMDSVLFDLKNHNLTNRKVAVIENGSWAAQSGKRIREYLEQMKGIEIMEETVSLKSSVKAVDVEAIEALAKALLAG